MLLTMLDTLRRMFSDARPIDVWMLVIELLVLLLIAGEVGVVLSRWLKRKGKLTQTFNLMSKGQQLENSVPPLGTADETAIRTWNESVKTWIGETNRFLVGCSQQASATFLHEEGGTLSSMRYHDVAKDAHDWYKTLIARLNNLRSVMEKPDVYF